MSVSPPIDNPDILRGPQRPELIRAEILADLFEATAARQPGHPALIAGERTLYYGELDALADLAASRLIEAGVRPGQIVGLWLPRGIELLVLQLAIAKTGAAWLPTDADTPVDRVAVCLDDAEGAGLVSCDEFMPRLASFGRPVWTAEALLAPATGAPLRRRQGAQPTDPAYVIYTSGSTGKPKGICITQGSICHFLRSENAVLGVRSDDRVYQGFSVAFDMSFEEIWISYLVGRHAVDCAQDGGLRPRGIAARTGRAPHHGAARRAHAAGAVRARRAGPAHRQPGR